MNHPPSLTIEANSAAAILSAPSQILVDETLLPAVASIDFGVRITVFDRSGCLRDPAVAVAGAPVRIEAVPHDVLLIVATASGGDAATGLAAAFEAADARPLPVRLSMTADATDPGAVRGEIASHILPILARRLEEAERTLSSREAELVDLRRLSEWQALGLRRGREIVEAIGFETRVLACELLPGARTLRPTGADAQAIVQRLPVDLSGISAVALHVAEGVDAEGRLVIGVTGPDRRLVQAQVDVDLRGLAEGWNEFRFPQAVGQVHGDALLTIAFLGLPNAAVPAFSLAADAVAGFGLMAPEGGGSLALRVWKGLSPLSFAGRPAQGLVQRSIRLDTAKLRASFAFLDGAAAEAVLRRNTGLGPLVAVGQDGGLRLRVLADRPTAMLLRSVLPPDTRAVRVAVPPVAGPSDAALLGGIVALDAGTPPDPEALRSMVDRLLDEGASGRAPSQPGATVRRLSNDRRVVLETPVEAVADARDLLVFVGPNAGAGIEVVAERLEVDTERPAAAAADRLAPFARRIPFPELKSRVGYVFGDGEGERASGTLGFPVIEVSDVENFMQTHPVPDAVAGARVRGVLPSGLIRVGATVGTMHPQGPLVEYALVVVRADAGKADPRDFAERIAAFLDAPDADAPDFVIGAERVTMEAGRRSAFELQLARPLDVPADLLCLVRSLSGHIGFAWCRWLGLDVEVASPKPNVPEAPQPASRRRLFPWR